MATAISIFHHTGHSAGQAVQSLCGHPPITGLPQARSHASNATPTTSETTERTSALTKIWHVTVWLPSTTPRMGRQWYQHVFEVYLQRVQRIQTSKVQAKKRNNKAKKSKSTNIVNCIYRK